VGPEGGQAHLAGEGRVTACVAALGHLVKRRGRPRVRVVDETGGQVWDETLQRAQPGPPAYTRLPLVLQMVLDCPPVSSDVAADRCVRPPSFPECVDLHVFSLCDHDLRAPSSAQGIDTQSMGGPARGVAPLVAPQVEETSDGRTQCSLGAQACPEVGPCMLLCRVPVWFDIAP
jgi:hypothetical protein